METIAELLHGYELDDINTAIAGDEGAFSDAVPMPARRLESPPTDRFKRARERKKNELAHYRALVNTLQHTLRALKQRQLLPGGSSRSQVVRAWQETALRQQRERAEAELLNFSLKRMVATTLKQARRLQSLLLPPDGLQPLVTHKRLQSTNIAAQMVVQETVEMHNLLLAVDLLEMLVDAIIAQFKSSTNLEVKCHPREGGCQILVEAMDTRVVPYDAVTASEHVWQVLAFENEACYNANETIAVTRGFRMDIASGDFRGSYVGTGLYRRRVTSDGSVVIMWSSDWFPAGESGHQGLDAITHECWRREGFVCIKPSVDGDVRVSTVHTFHRVERDGCGDAHCERGAFGDKTVEKAEQGIKDCVSSECTRLVQNMENDIIQSANK